MEKTFKHLERHKILGLFIRQKLKPWKGLVWNECGYWYYKNGRFIFYLTSDSVYFDYYKGKEVLYGGVSKDDIDLPNNIKEAIFEIAYQLIFKRPNNKIVKIWLLFYLYLIIDNSKIIHHVKKIKKRRFQST